MKLKVHSLRVEKTMTYNDREDEYEYNEFFILNCISDNHAKYEIRLYTLYGDCYSGWCDATWGIGYIYHVDSFVGMTHKPIKELKFEIDENLISNNGRIYDMKNDIFELDYNNYDDWYPSGSAKVNMNLFKEINRNKEKRPVWIFKGDSALGKSYLAGIIANNGREKSVYETDAHEELDDIHQDIVVIGNKYKHSVEDVESHILGEHETILVDFSKA